MASFFWAGNIDTHTTDALKTLSGMPAGDKIQLRQHSLNMVHKIDGRDFDPFHPSALVPDIMLENPGDTFKLAMFGGRRIYTAFILSQETFSDGQFTGVIGASHDDVNDLITITPNQTGHCICGVLDDNGQRVKKMRSVKDDFTSGNIFILEFYAFPEIVDPITGIKVPNTALSVGQTIDIAFYGQTDPNTGFFSDRFDIPPPSSYSLAIIDNDTRRLTANVVGVHTVTARTLSLSLGNRSYYKEVVDSFTLTVV